MKNIHFTKKALVVFLFICTIFFATNAEASFLGSITSKLFTGILKLIGFGSSEDGFCWFCPIFTTIFNTINTLATNVAQQLRNVALMTLGVGVLFFIAFRVGAMVIKLQEVDLMQFLGDLFKNLGRAMIAAAIIAGTVQIFFYLITPLLAYSLNLSISFVQDHSYGSGIVGKLVKMATGDLTKKAQGLCTSYQYYAEATLKSDTPPTTAFSLDLLYALRCMLATVSANLVSGMVLGLCVIGMGMFANIIFPDLPIVISGGIIFGSFFIIYLKVPFVLLDNLIRLAFVAALMPFWVILWVFPATVQYTKNAWNMFLATCVSFISCGVVIAIITSLMSYMCPNMNDILMSMIPGYDLIASSKASAFSSNTLLTLALGVFCGQLLKVPDEFAARITQSYGIGVAQGMETQLTSVASRSLGLVGGIGAVGGGIMAVSSGKFDEDKFRKSADSFSGGQSLVPKWLGLDNSWKPVNTRTYVEQSKQIQSTANSQSSTSTSTSTSAPTPTSTAASSR